MSPLRDFEVLSRDMIRILSHAEIFPFAAFKCLQSGNMDSRVFMEPLSPCLGHSWTPCPCSSYRLSAYNLQTLGLQLMRRERPLLIRLSLTRLLFLLLPESLRLNLARIRLSLKRLLLIGLISLTLVFYWEF